jgi:hypothetical protein
MRLRRSPFIDRRRPCTLFTELQPEAFIGRFRGAPTLRAAATPVAIAAIGAAIAMVMVMATAMAMVMAVE